MLTIGLQVVLWTAPIVYVADVRTQPGWFVRALPWHPLYPPLVAVRDLFLRGTLPDPWVWLGAVAWPAAFLLLAHVAFERLRPEIRDVL